jgi:peptidoglycan/xylan/chitin deacetylase (PgdA/CDA1 family)
MKRVLATRRCSQVACCAPLLLLPLLPSLARAEAPACANPVYLTIDPAAMDFAPRVAEVLRRQQVQVTYWVSNQRTRNGEGSLGNLWGSWWKQVAQQGHEFASQTYDQVYWRADLPGYKTSFRIKPTTGSMAGREFTYDPAKYCEQIEHAARRSEDFTGKKSLPLFHAPGGNTSPKLLASASACGFAHVGFSKEALLGKARPLTAALAGIRSGDVLLLDLNAAANAEPWAMANLEPLLLGLKARGLCFATLRQHPGYRDWIAGHGG